MKKIYGIIICFLLVLVTACNNDKAEYECSLKIDADEYKVSSTYYIYSKGDVVEKINTKETITSSDKATLEYFESQIKSSYDSLSEAYGGHSYDVKITEEKLTSNVTVDYTKMDTKKFFSNQSQYSKYVNDKNQLTVTGIKKIYESLGAECK